MRILGLSCYTHDAAAVLFEDGRLVAAAAEERFSRLKGDPSFPRQAIRFCLSQASATPPVLDYVAFFERPVPRLHRALRSALSLAPRGGRLFRREMATGVLDRLSVRQRIQDALKIPARRVIFVEHQAAHAASAFFCSPFDEAAVLSLDTLGEWATAASGVGRTTRLTLDRELRFPDSLGLLYLAFARYIGLAGADAEYHLMALSRHGTPRFETEVWQLVDAAPDGAFRLRPEYFAFDYPDRLHNSRFDALFGSARASTPQAGFEGIAENARAADLAASVQKVVEALTLRTVTDLCARTGHTRLCLAGSGAQNALANGRIVRDTPVTDLFVQPAAGESGAALGAALYVQHDVLGLPRTFVMEHASWGAAIEPSDVLTVARESGLVFIECEERELIDRTVELLLAGRIVAWAQERFEWGPRALGNRSILADPRRTEMRDGVNAKAKFRETYRSYSPSVLAERASEMFDLPDPVETTTTRFMSVAVPVRPAARDRLQAIAHVDGLARVQTVIQATNPRYHALIERFGEATGVPALLNTSLAIRGEPIVATPADAMNTFMRSGLDALVLDRTILFKDSA